MSFVVKLLKLRKGMAVMKNNGKNLLKVASMAGICACLYANGVVADDDVAELIVDNGTPVSVPEPSTLALFLAGAVGVGIAKSRNRKDK